MYGLGGLFVNTAFLPKFRIEHTEIAERNVGCNDIEFPMLQLLPVYCFKPSCHGGCFIMQKRKHKPGNDVLFNGVAVCAAHSHRQETSDACARFEEAAHLQSVLPECGVYLTCDGFNEEIRRIERSQHGSLYTVHQQVVIPLAPSCKSSQNLLQAVCLLRQFFGHGDLRSDSQHFLDTSKARILRQYLFLFLCGFPALFVDSHRCFYGGHICRQ